MQRWDEIGLFWEDLKVEKVRKEPKPKREPPDPLWLSPDYLPWLDEARATEFDFFTDTQLIDAQRARETLVWDIEVYPNLFLGGFKSIESGKIAQFEFTRETTLPDVEYQKFAWILNNFLFVGFNDTDFDLPIATAFLDGFSTDELMDAVNELIFGDTRPWQFYTRYKLQRPRKLNHIDLIELTALSPSLKISAGRLHAPRMQDLPFLPGTELTGEQVEVLRWYWANDLDNTILLYHHKKPEIDLRATMGKTYRLDLRSKSDPQIAEAVIRHELKRLTRRDPKPSEITDGSRFRYRPPDYLRYQTPMMQHVLDFIREQEFIVGPGGSPMLPEGLKALVVCIGAASYQLGIGGLHSREKCVIHHADEEFDLSDVDVTSYYPSLILQQGMYPPSLGREFLQVYNRLYQRRLMAKAAGDKTTTDTLKIVLNGTFGKTGERGGHSILYHPEMMIQITLTGQLLLLLLIEWLELAGITVVSANTDGLLIKCRRAQLDTRDRLIAHWQQVTGLQMEFTAYRSVYIRDVNNYISLYAEPKKGSYAKAKGAYAFAAESGLKKNPTGEICVKAVIHHLALGTPFEETIRGCRDLTQFLEVRQVRGGACKDGEYLGKAVRWYYATGVEGEIINAKNGHNVPRSLGAKPCMRLPNTFPEDICYEYYLARARDMIAEFTPEAERDDSESERKVA